ncbi:hypothetical protein B1750_gp443 [Noumeavirus]|uniref:hypothetical protein n=1 Tax=Noumeavirus TaxID=1955558 RepID=UPI000982E4EC|nr:hypothetical protein B1750_gp443 [Noumeavirus]AQM73424.1 hypothetical protein NMV_443 [Noumeavirus]
MRFVCKEYGTPRLPFEGIAAKGTFHVSPTGKLHGPYLAFFGGSVKVSTFSHGVLSGFQMSVFENGYVESGTYRNGKRVGLWRNDSEGFRNDWNGSARRVMHNQDGSSYSHSKEDNSDTIFLYDKDNRILAMYKEHMMGEDFHCENSGKTFCAGYIPFVPFTEGTYSAVGTHLFHCCKEHQGDMPNDLLYFEQPDCLLLEEKDQ